MDDYSLVQVEHQPDFENVSLVPVDHDPFGVNGVTQQAPEADATDRAAAAVAPAADCGEQNTEEETNV